MSALCIWEDCDQAPIYCEGHAREYMQPDIDTLRGERDALRAALLDIMARWETDADSHYDAGEFMYSRAREALSGGASDSASAQRPEET